MAKYKHYIRVDNDSNILWGYATEGGPMQSTDILLKESRATIFKLFKSTVTAEELVNKYNVPLYKFIDGEIVPVDQEIIEDASLSMVEVHRRAAIEDTKNYLNEILDIPMPFRGGLYTVTSDKQNLLSAQLGMFMLNSQIGLPYTITWNETGKECTEWAFEDLVALTNTIDAYVKPLASAQRTAEKLITASTDSDEINGIVDSYKTNLSAVAAGIRGQLETGG